MMRNMRIQSAAAANLSCGDHSNFESTLRMADDRLPCCRSESITATRSDDVMWRLRGAGNWLAGHESGAYDLISLAERGTRSAERNAPREYEARAGSAARQGTGRHVSSKRSAEHHSRSL